MTDARVRRASPDDAEGIVALLADVAAEGWLGTAGPPHTPAEERAALAAAPPDDFAVWVGDADGRVVGHLLLARGPRPYCDHTASVAVAVAAAARGRGLGGRLLAAGAAWAAEHGVAKLCAAVFADNARALALFAGQGFVREGLRARQFRIGGVWRDEVLLARFLGGPAVAPAR
jgi:L-amino acid N-acyltransferase YncA